MGLHRVGLITDLHIKLDKQAFDVDTKTNFVNVLNALQKWNCESLIIAGDFCFQISEKGVYEFAKKHLDQFGVPYHIISGNHDDPAMMNEVFDLEKFYRKEENEFFYTKIIGERAFIFLDTGKGNISWNQLNWLSLELNNVRELYPVIIMHYPPINCGVPHMDNNYAFKDSAVFMEVISNFQGPLSIFTGHYHVEKTIIAGNATVFITPSCFIQIDQVNEEFTPDHFRPAYRIIDFSKQLIQTGVHYI